MSSILSPFRGFGTAGLCTVALFAIAAWIPNDAIDLVAWLMAVFLGLPVSILAKVHSARKALPTSPRAPATPTFPQRVFGALSLLLGVGVLGWQAYNLFVRRLPEVIGLTAVAQALLPVALIGFGYRLLRRRPDVEHIDHDAA